MSKRRPAYPAEFQQQIVELAHAGRSVIELSREFGPSEQTIRNWLTRAARDADKPLKGGLSNKEREELARLRRENRQLKMERDILAKATAWFARKGDTSTPNSSGS